MGSIELQDHLLQVTVVNETEQRTNRNSKSNYEKQITGISRSHCGNNRKL